MRLLPNSYAAVIYPNGTSPEDVLASLSVIIADLQIRVKEKRKAVSEG